MISLSKRLSMAAALVPPCEVLADVGTDHGYLAAWLLQHGRAQKVLASDIGEGPLRSARETAARYGLEDSLQTILADGLNYPGSDQAEVITICGMGGETMISILSAAPWTKNGRRLILQPQSKLAELESWLKQEGYAVQNACLSIDAGKCYLAMSVLGGSEWEFGAETWLLRNHDSLFAEYLSREMKKVTHALIGLKQAVIDQGGAITALEERLETLQQYEKEMQSWKP